MKRVEIKERFEINAVVVALINIECQMYKFTKRLQSVKSNASNLKKTLYLNYLPAESLLFAPRPDLDLNV